MRLSLGPQQTDPEASEHVCVCQERTPLPVGQLHGSGWEQTLATGSQLGSGPLVGDKQPLCASHSGFRGQEECSEAGCEHSRRGGSSYKIINATRGLRAGQQQPNAGQGARPHRLSKPGVSATLPQL